MSGARVLITGGAGFIGSHTADELSKRGYKIRILDNLSPGVHFSDRAGRGVWPNYLGRKYQLVKGDVRRRSDWEKSLDGVDYVVHLAALADLVPDYEEFFEINVTGTALLYQVIRERKLPIKKIVVASTQFVYGEGRLKCRKDGVVMPGQWETERLDRGDWEPVCPGCGGEIEYLKYEETHHDPPNHYSITKYAAEMIALKLGRINNIPSVAMRIFALGVLVGKAPVVYEDGKQLRDFVSVYDVARANAVVLENRRADYENFNVGGGQGRTVVGLAVGVCEAMGLKVRIKPSGKYRVGDARHCVSDISKLKGLGWEPKVSMEESIKEYVEWLKRQRLNEDYLGAAQKKMQELDMVRQVHV